jgi:hypothetical protein
MLEEQATLDGKVASEHWLLKIDRSSPRPFIVASSHSRSALDCPSHEFAHQIIFLCGMLRDVLKGVHLTLMSVLRDVRGLSNVLRLFLQSRDLSRNVCSPWGCSCIHSDVHTYHSWDLTEVIWFCSVVPHSYVTWLVESRTLSVCIHLPDCAMLQLRIPHSTFLSLSASVQYNFYLSEMYLIITYFSLVAGRNI